MRLRTPSGTSVVIGSLLVLLAACQGNIGSGSGLSIPQAAAPYQPGGPGQTSTSRERALEGAVYLSSSSPLPSLPLPTIEGFGIAIALGTPGPSPSPAPSTSASPTAKKASKRTHTSAVAHRYVIALAAPAASPSPEAVASQSPAAVPSAGASGTATAASAPSAAGSGSAAPPGVTHLSDVPSPSGSGSPRPAGSGAPAASASPAGHHHTHPAINSGPKIVTKTVAYPDDAPAAPTPEPTGNVQTFPVRTALVRGYLMPAVDVPIYGLGAIKFTVPKSEVTASRGYTIAVFTSAKKHRGKLLEYDTSPTVGTDSVTSSYADDPIVFKKSIGYEIVLYADPGLATPAPIASGAYPNAGTNPVPYPSGLTPPPGTGQTPIPPGYPTPIPPGYPTPYPAQTYFH